jgi:hypothetical protein
METPLPDSAEGNPKRPDATRGFLVSILWGVAGYFVALLALVAATRPASDGEIFLAMSQNWSWAGLAGFLFALASGLSIRRRQPENGKTPWWSAPAAFGLPFFAAWLLTLGFSNVYPSLAHDYELSFGTLLSVLFLLAVAISLRLRKRTLGDAWGGFVAAPVLGLLMVAGWFSWQILTSNDFVYRNAFEVHNLQIDRDGSTITVRAVLTLGKSGPFQYEAASYWLPMDESEGKAQGLIRWEKGSQPTEAGDYPFTITWTDLPDDIIESLGKDGIDDTSMGLSVMKKNGDPQKREMIRHLSFWLPAE